MNNSETFFINKEKSNHFNQCDIFIVLQINIRQIGGMITGKQENPEKNTKTFDIVHKYSSSVKLRANRRALFSVKSFLHASVSAVSNVIWIQCQVIGRELTAPA